MSFDVPRMLHFSDFVKLVLSESETSGDASEKKLLELNHQNELQT